MNVRTLIMALGASLLFSVLGCGSDNSTNPAFPWIADFESGSDPINTEGGNIGSWAFGATAVTEYVAGGANDSKFAAQVTITGNTGTPGWTGAGLVVTLRDSDAPQDLAGYTNLEFDVRISAGLSETKVKLEDTAGSNQPELSISAYAPLVEGSWSHVRIPLADFATLRAGDPDWWRPVNLASVVRFITVSVHDSKTANGDGSIQVDNVFVSR